MTSHVLVGRHVKPTIWDDLVDLMPARPVGLITQVIGDGSEVVLTVQFPGFKLTYSFYLVDVELLPADYTEAALFTATHPDQQQDAIQLQANAEAARHEGGENQPVHRVAVCLSRDGHRLLPLGSFSPDFDATWATSAEPHADGSVTARGPLPGWLFTPVAVNGNREKPSRDC